MKFSLPKTYNMLCHMSFKGFHHLLNKKNLTGRILWLLQLSTRRHRSSFERRIFEPKRLLSSSGDSVLRIDHTLR